MLTSETQIRVRYAETDQMGYVYYGKYAEYYEVARTDALRTFDLTYREMEEKGVMLPVLSMNIKYIRPAYYDDLLTVKITIKELPASRIKFDCEIFNEKGELLNIGDVTLAFVDARTRKPCKAPEHFLEKIKDFFQDNANIS